jgi:hypothetical protein
VDVSEHAGKSFMDFLVVDHVPNDPTNTLYLEHLKLDTDTLVISFYSWQQGKYVELPGNGTDYVFEASSQTQGGPEVAVLVVNSLIVGAENVFAPTGSRPLVVVAATTMELGGEIQVKTGMRPGPVPSAQWDGVPGPGPGGGKQGQNTMYAGGAGGGSYCSAGGKGGDDYNQPSGGQPGAVYGTPALVPLEGGSSGAMARGSSCVDTNSEGGGAMQLVAGESITIDGWISAPGNGGCDGYRWGGSAGGSGGAILIEAPEVTHNGNLAANGGGGGGDFYPGAPGNETASPAAGDCGGNGAAGDQPAKNGADDSDTTCDTPSAGGGGAGWIRINTATGTVTQGASAVLSPTLSTNCTTFGTLSP